MYIGDLILMMIHVCHLDFQWKIQPPKMSQDANKFVDTYFFQIQILIFQHGMLEVHQNILTMIGVVRCTENSGDHTVQLLRFLGKCIIL